MQKSWLLPHSGSESRETVRTGRETQRTFNVGERRWIFATLDLISDVENGRALVTYCTDSDVEPKTPTLSKIQCRRKLPPTLDLDSDVEFREWLAIIYAGTSDIGFPTLTLEHPNHPRLRRWECSRSPFVFSDVGFALSPTLDFAVSDYFDRSLGVAESMVYVHKTNVCC